MNNLNLLAYFGIGAIGMIVGLKIALLIMQASRPYPPYGGTQSTTNSTTTESGSDALFSLMVFIVLSLFTYWVGSNYSHNKQVPQTPKVEEEKEEERIAQTPKKLVIKYQENRRVNRAPRKERKYVQYGIQVTAVSSQTQAEKRARELREAYNVTILEEDDLFKVVVLGGFLTKSAAIDYQKKYSLLEKGYIRLLS